jgi:hypothetical protein
MRTKAEHDNEAASRARLRQASKELRCGCHLTRQTPPPTCMLATGLPICRLLTNSTPAHTPYTRDIENFSQVTFAVDHATKGRNKQASSWRSLDKRLEEAVLQKRMR